MKSQMPFEVPCIVDGKPVKTGNILQQNTPHDHQKVLCNYHAATPEVVEQAIAGALNAQRAWEDLPWNDRAAIFLKAADLVAGKYRYVGFRNGLVWRIIGTDLCVCVCVRM